MGESVKRIRSAFVSPGMPPSRRAPWLGVLTLVLMTGLPVASSAAELQPLIDRMDRVERDLRTLNVRVARGVTPGNPVMDAAPAEFDSTGSLARMDVRITDLEEEVRGLTGKVETVEYNIRKVGERLEKLVADVDFRLRAVEGGNAPQTTLSPAPAASATPAETPAATVPRPAGSTMVASAGGAGDMTRPASAPGVFGTLSPQEAAAASRQAPAPMTPDTPQAGARGAEPSTAMVPAPAQGSAASPDEKYRQAFALLRQTRYPEAEAALRDFVDTNPTHELAGNARYWLGETHYVRAQYAQAAQVFLESYSKDPKGKKAPDSLLKLGMSLSNLEKKREACAAYTKLDREFPDAPGNIKKVVVREREQNGCR